MARKGGVSKNSRAARRGDADPFTSSEAKELAAIPRLENTDTVSSIIRSSLSKNQRLLNDKVNRLSKNENKLKPGDHIITTHANKKRQHMVSKTVRSKQSKFLNIDGRLSKKIENALNRKKKIANLRKAGWEQINEVAKKSLEDDIVSKINSEKQTNQDLEDQLLDEMRDDDEIVQEIVKKQQNPFALLPEEE
ncbi:hypothetical protein CAS74_003275 [Pichia kudriavzevii]|uniref:Uncharacterized protein n=1 Tax=Pichia kudriavzevii TaxID=4909 RepID=A0A099NYW1_PICKU|nr:uncharacterized protein C5L36_0B01790 [Pichia kudriavzevii]AWU74915.1 hypothetical protein C5L36_0B01790 [Pichia kudriavzevii]KGK37107.1 hypothetical protein JL09_g3762 [Pichia kudriavzevii]ONH73303.1 hypothetical protein BOH78_3184 [Pichia kudriavzevii]OUT21160.1 hypothetical protein CAS74_003275 [Pichia kudriavzevii]